MGEGLLSYLGRMGSTEDGGCDAVVQTCVSKLVSANSDVVESFVDNSVRGEGQAFEVKHALM